MKLVKEHKRSIFLLLDLWTIISTPFSYRSKLLQDSKLAHIPALTELDVSFIGPEDAEGQRWETYVHLSISLYSHSSPLWNSLECTWQEFWSVVSVQWTQPRPSLKQGKKACRPALLLQVSVMAYLLISFIFNAAWVMEVPMKTSENIWTHSYKMSINLQWMSCLSTVMFIKTTAFCYTDFNYTVHLHFRLEKKHDLLCGHYKDNNL